MKKTYISPDTTAVEIQAQQLVAMSVQNGTADPNGDVLSREIDEMWEDIWAEEEKLK